MSEKEILKKIWPLGLTLLVILLDQLTKALVVKFIPVYSLFNDDCVVPVIGDFLRLIHVRNKAVAFSLGSSLPAETRRLLFSFLPLVIIAIVFVLYFKNKEFTSLQSWAICGILGGGLGNLIDRFFRPDGVVDFIDCYFFGLFGLERWPTFNIADSAVVVCGILFMLSFIFQIKETPQ
ncbi:MAG: signal peptidase II [Treponema sp.]|nr:signal peptidase II [Treponema sp.]